MTKLLALPATLLAVLLAALLGAAVLGSPALAVSSAGQGRPIIVEVRGDAANGFDIVHADGTTLHPPTDSEAAAECGEYDTLRARVACRVEVRTWYRDLGDLKRSLAWVRAHG